ncbi:DUF4136 domain-containing protein [Jiulongibacter sp. NS-SX5]|uniref:DUF4136 domain-containing protein n=1 Tax=Jiulongibacter sp. NS-SX5 TaxID=3463854 RepID=UPI004058A6D2
MKILTYGLLLMVSLTSCTKTLWIDAEPNIDLKQYGTFGWNTNNDLVGHVYYNKEKTDATLKPEIERLLIQKGYKLSQPGEADFFLDYHIYIEQDYFSEVYCPTGYYNLSGLEAGLSPGPRCEVPKRVRNYDSQTFVIDIIDTKTGQLVWRGSSFDVIDNPKDLPYVLKRRAKKMLKAIY